MYCNLELVQQERHTQPGDIMFLVENLQTQLKHNSCTSMHLHSRVTHYTHEHTCKCIHLGLSITVTVSLYQAHTHKLLPQSFHQAHMYLHVHINTNAPRTHPHTHAHTASRNNARGVRMIDHPISLYDMSCYVPQCTTERF